MLLTMMLTKLKAKKEIEFLKIKIAIQRMKRQFRE